VIFIFVRKTKIKIVSKGMKNGAYKKMNISNQQKYQANLRKNLSLSGQAATFFAEYQAQKLAEWFPSEIDQRISILDFGCGDGLITSFVQHIFVHAAITGIDTDPECIALAKDVYEGIHFVCTDIETEQPFAPASFDLIYATEVFHHLPPEKHAQYIALLIRLLKPHGMLVIFELNPLNLATVCRFKKNPLEQHADLIWPWTLQRLLTSYGKTTLRFYDFFPNILHRMRTIERYINWFPLGALYAMSVTKLKNQD